MKKLVRHLLRPIWEWANGSTFLGQAGRLKRLSVNTTLGTIQQVVDGWSPPPGQEWVEPDGRTLLKQDYPELYAILGNKYGGSEDGIAFCIPDFRSEIFTLDQVEGAALDLPIPKTLMRIK